MWCSMLKEWMWMNVLLGKHPNVRMIYVKWLISRCFKTVYGEKYGSAKNRIISFGTNDLAFNSPVPWPALPPEWHPLSHHEWECPRWKALFRWVPPVRPGTATRWTRWSPIRDRTPSVLSAPVPEKKNLAGMKSKLFSEEEDGIRKRSLINQERNQYLLEGC